jgi:hypothetical protein
MVSDRRVDVRTGVASTAESFFVIICTLLSAFRVVVIARYPVYGDSSRRHLGASAPIRRGRNVLFLALNSQIYEEAAL